MNHFILNNSLFILFNVGLLSGCNVSSSMSEDTDTNHTPSYYRPADRQEVKTIQCDVAVYGGTPAGVTAAIQAARMGKNAVLLSFNQHVGSMTSGGLAVTDIGRKESVGGLAMEFYERVGRVRMFRPFEAESLYLEMLDEVGGTVLFERALESVEKKNTRLISMTMETNETIQAEVFIDAPMKVIKMLLQVCRIGWAGNLPAPMESPWAVNGRTSPGKMCISSTTFPSALS